MTDQTANNADFVKLIKDGAIFIGPHGAPTPDGHDWAPGPEYVNLGYYSEDGFTLTPAPGDTTEFKAHNGDVVLSEQADGNWTIAFSGIQDGVTLTEAYFDTEVDPLTGGYKLTSAAVKTYRALVLIGEGSNGDVIVHHAPRVKVSEREALTFNATTLSARGVTFTTYKDATLGYQAYGWNSGLIEKPAPTVTGATPSAAATGTTVTITGTGLTGANKVTFGSTNGTAVTVVSDTSITAVMPAGTAGSAAIKVTTPGGVSAPYPYTRG
ncbi:hypothetical protein GCM10022198_00190 [Klugiella xanthotipulae]|uniref:IPT/TIG domain-containing protein n=1 Tax=Klugiella xanthotipulae TaxID=244735 RepID=A0A543I5V6_9MICO|nr:IPT/TIG domain-containing protein [Klugiella xanthotipulae]TQM65840.1 IPT/TIG domain-containing protein [Klugiella xanthotipulae]